ncbi:MAG: hypothetical protein RML32_08310 [Gammaproteobacteria bacterium]|nr:hypothetical protein [Gammaproteobacteria bacterium]
MVQIATANTNRDGTDTMGTVLTGASTGTVINLIRVVATGTTTAGVVRLFLHDGTNTRLLQEILVPAITPSTTVPVFSRSLMYVYPEILFLPSASWQLRASTNNAETFNVFAFGANL